MAGLPSFFKTKRYKRFAYKPMYYDADKEALEDRVARIKSELKNERGSTQVKGRLQGEWRKNSNLSNNSSNTLRIFIIAGILAIIFYLYLYA